MTPERLEQLLYESESETLDFKEGQYPFANATDEQKSELLKDILGFANAWRRSEAYIVVGVREISGGKSVVTGVDTHLADHSLQQFVNSKTNRPVRFSYEATTCEDKSVGIITIPQQTRPFCLSKDYGKLEKDKVYVRRGSSIDITRPATPDEIIKMRDADAQQAASLDVQFYDPAKRRLLGRQLHTEGTFMRFPSSADLPPLSPPSAYSGPFGMLNLGSMLRDTNPDYYKQVAVYCHRHANFQPVQLAIVNTGEVAAEDARLEINLPSAGLEVLEEWEMDEDFPQKDYDRLHLASTRAGTNSIQPLHRRDGDIVIIRDSDTPVLDVEYRKVQPGRTVLTDKFYVACCQSGTVTVAGRVFSRNLPQPIDVELSFQFDITAEEVDRDRFLRWADDPEGKEEE